MISLRRRLEFARGYLELGLRKEAAQELAAVDDADRAAIDVLEIHLELAMHDKEWAQVVDLSTTVAAAKPELEHVWIHWAYALRELQRIPDAREVLLKAELLHGGSSPVLHYNLACYCALLGDLREARRRLSLASKKDKSWRAEARKDPDLKALWTELEGA